MESRQDLRTGSGFARTNLALVVCTRSRGDALGGETDMSNQNPRYALGNPKCVSLFSLLQSLPSSTRSDTSGVQRPTDCLWSGWMRWERGLNCPEQWARPTDPWNPDRRQLISKLRPWQVNGEKPSSHPRTSHAFDHLSTMKDEILNLNLNEQGSVVDCPSAFEEVSGQVKAAALSLLKVFKVFPRRWSLSKPRGKPSWRSQPWPRTDASGDKIKSYGTNERAFLSEIDRSTNLQHLHQKNKQLNIACTAMIAMINGV